MQKQRSPFTGGTSFGAGAFNFNAQFVDASNYVSTDGLNGMPFLTKTQLPMPVQHLPKEIIRSLSHQRDNGDATDCGPVMEALSGGDRPKQLESTTLQDQTNAIYEGEFSQLSSTDDKPSPFKSQIKKDSTKKRFSKKNEFGSETDSDARDFGNGEQSLWQKTCNYIKTSMSTRNQRRLDMALYYCAQQPIYGYFLVIVQFVSVALDGLVNTIQRIGTKSQTRIHLWSYSFHLRSTVRNMLWRMANSKTNDTFLFLIIVLVAPWLFVLGLFGFAVSFVVSLKTVLTETIHQVHFRVV